MSVQTQYSLPPYDIEHVVLNGGNGSDTTTNIAKAFLDMRTRTIFSFDISELTPGPYGNNNNNNYVYIKLDTLEGSPGALAGKEIVLLFTGTPNSHGVRLSFTSNFGQNISNLNDDDVNTYTGNRGAPTAMKLMSNGIDFIITGATYADG